MRQEKEGGHWMKIKKYQENIKLKNPMAEKANGKR